MTLDEKLGALVDEFAPCLAMAITSTMDESLSSRVAVKYNTGAPDQARLVHLLAGMQDAYDQFLDQCASTLGVPLNGLQQIVRQHQSRFREG